MDFIFYSILAVIGISISSGPLGAIVLWNRFVYFSDAIVHNVFLGFVLGAYFGVHQIISISLLSYLFSIIFYRLKVYKRISNEALLTVMVSFVTALGIVFLPRSLDSITGLLFGDILMISMIDLVVIYILALCVIVVTFIRLKCWILYSINRDIALVEYPKHNDFEIIILIVTFIAVSVNIVGMFLVSIILIAPSFVASIISKSPLKMMINGSILSILFMLLGLLLSYIFDIPAAPTSVLSSCFVLLICLCYKYNRR